MCLTVDNCTYIIKYGLLYIHAAQGSVVAGAQQLVRMRPGERHAAHRTRVGLKEQNTVIAPFSTLIRRKKNNYIKHVWGKLFKYWPGKENRECGWDYAEQACQ